MLFSVENLPIFHEKLDSGDSEPTSAGSWKTPGVWPRSAQRDDRYVNQKLHRHPHISKAHPGP